MATFMENGGGGGFDGWDNGQFDEAATGDANLSIDMDEFLGLLDEDPDPVPVKGSLENPLLMETFTNPSNPSDGIPNLQHKENVFQVPEIGSHDSLLAARNRVVEAHFRDQHQFSDIHYSPSSMADSSRADGSVFEGFGNSSRNSFFPYADSEWHHMLNDNGCNFPSNEENGPTTDSIAVEPDFEYSSNDLIGDSWQSADQFFVDDLPTHSSQIIGSIYGSEIDCQISAVGGTAPYANGAAPYANALPVCKPSQSWNGPGMMQAIDDRVNFHQLQFDKLITEASARKISSLAAKKVIWSADSSSALSRISRDASKRSLTFSENGEKSVIPKLFKRARISQGVAEDFKSISSIEDGFMRYNVSMPCLTRRSFIDKMHPDYRNDEASKCPSHLHKASFHSSPESSQSNSVDCRSHADNADICILEEISHPARPNLPVTVVNTRKYHDTLNYAKVGLTRPSVNSNAKVGLTTPNVNSEQSVLCVALQDIAQPKSEDTLPAGILAVPLLRHQRIALSWMVKKETAINCSGGILADDQGLGKTVSTIALILKERPPSVRPCQQHVMPDDIQNLDSDSDDDNNNIKETKFNSGRRGCNVHKVMSHGTQERNHNASGHGSGRPAAGTLVVCPTSVLRQWADELQNKVSDAATLSVLVYHGGNRTKDPLDLTKYDVVLTTYSIVSMEVPKQPLVDKDGDEKGKDDDLEPPPIGSLPSKRNENSTAKKKPKNKKITYALMESITGPLAKVGWFRVVLDEAQSIKNHRTQVARACWGLRAKRRWCLSGTPIQNSIDDLYSYFRFLRYDPYAVYKTFIGKVKAPIQKSPSKGYRKLQAILKTIMLRRTKGTFLDGKPIITLPPKYVELKKVEFSDEERDFYMNLEANSRAQFEEYAAAGTVKENYVNILLMLLRLRQACDHPLLVKGYASSSSLKSSIEMARKLPREKQMHLLKCLEASLAICCICNDPPEEAVVSVCGHVFCNQCVIEHLSGDNSHCAVTNCKAKLAMSSVFNRSSLITALSGNCAMDSSADHMGESCSQNSPFGSSKIRAALEVLQSLSNNTKNSADISASSMSPVKIVDDISDCGNLEARKGSSDINKPSGEKAIVFSQWTGMLDLLEACLKDSSIQYRRLDGTMSVLARDKAVKDFNTLPEVTVIIMSLKAASLGLNMVSACHVLLLDIWWNPTTEDQAIDRAHRIGQTRPVKVLRLTVKDTVEDRILALQQKKRVMVASAFGEDESGGRQSRLTVQDLAYLFMA